MHKYTVTRSMYMYTVPISIYLLCDENLNLCRDSNLASWTNHQCSNQRIIETWCIYWLSHTRIDWQHYIVRIIFFPNLVICHLHVKYDIVKNVVDRTLHCRPKFGRVNQDMNKLENTVHQALKSQHFTC